MPINWRNKNDGTDSPEAVLKEAFGHDTFRYRQKEAIEAALRGENILRIAPTGSGKSISYQVPAVLERKRRSTLVVSPLIALMRDQVRGLTAAGIPATELHSDVTDRDDVIEKAKFGRYALIYASPEQLQKDDVRDSLRGRVARMDVDEAHCISQWGNDFRPTYRLLGQAKEELQIPAASAFTATASHMVQKDIMSTLKMESCTEIIDEPYRPNLEYSITKIDGYKAKRETVLERVKESSGASIVYCGTKRNTEQLFEFLKSSGVDTEYYHGNLLESDRRRIEERFKDGRTKVLVATNAFGMGIDKSDIRRVIHFQIPGTVQAYLQETGRAGRDGEAARCELLYSDQDIGLQEYLIESRSPDAWFTLAIFKNLKSMETKARAHGGYFRPNLFGLYKTFEKKRHGQIISKQTEVNAAISMLEAADVIERNEQAIRILQDFDKGDEIYEVISGISDVRRQIAGLTLGQIIRYVQDPAADQRMLIDLLNEEIEGKD